MIVGIVGNKEYIGTRTSRDIEAEKKEEALLEKSLQMFDFSVPLPDKTKNIVRVFYNNCNGLEVNRMLEDLVQRERDKFTHNYLKDIENPTKLDRLLRQMKVWDTDIVLLAETCVDWSMVVPRRAIKKITSGYNRTACWTGSSSKISVGNYLKPGGTGMLAMGSCNGRILDRGTDPGGMGR